MVRSIKTFRTFGKSAAAAAAMLALGAPGLTGSAEAGVVFSQGFSGSTNVNDYVSGAGTGSELASIGVDADSTASVAISNGALSYSFAEDTDTLLQGGGTFEHNALGAPDLFSARFTLTISNPGGNHNGSPRAALTFGSDTSGNIRNEIQFTVTSSGVNVALRGSGLGTTSVDAGDSFVLSLYENSTAGAESFVGPDGSQHTIDPGSNWLFVNDTAFAENVVIFKADKTLAGLFFAANTANFGKPNLDNVTFAFDQIVIRDDLGVVPEPASLALLGAGGVVMGLRRR